MPFVTLVTNLPDDQIPEDFNEKLNRALADAIPEKPYEYFAIHVVSSKRFTFGGKSDPAAMLKITAFNIFNPKANVSYSKAIGKFLESSLGIKCDKILIEFLDISASNCGFNYTTCQELIDQGKF